MTRSFLLGVLPLFIGGALGACRGAAAPTANQDATSLSASASAPLASASPPSAPLPFGSAAIDAAIRAEWAKRGITPAPRVDDARFLRRAYIDIVGTVPPPAVVRSFMADSAPDKRAKLVDSLLASPAYAAYWATLWEDTLVGWSTKEQLIDRGALRDWLEAEFAANAPWDKIVTELMTATGQNSRGGKRRQDDAPAPMGEVDDDAPAHVGGPPINGAVNWFLKYRDTPQDIAGNASRIFLGVQIQCAQCHDHKTEKWKQDDFRRFAACFARTRTEVLDKGKTMGKKRVFVTDIGRPLPRFAKNPELAPILQAEPTTLDGTDIGATPDTRRAVAAWMTSKDNPWFAKAIVNRMWGHFLGRGFVDPVDDIRDSNPATMPDTFAKLSEDFLMHGDDLKSLIRTITMTEAYQLAPVPKGQLVDTPADPGAPERLWAHFHISPLGPNELLRSILDVTQVENVIAKNNRANLDRIRFQLYQRYVFLFDVDEDVEQTGFEGTVSQALTLLNGELVGGGTSGVPGGALDATLKGTGTDADKVTDLYVRTLSRAPSAEELAYWTAYVNEPHPVDVVDADHTTPGRPPMDPAPGSGGSGGKIGKNGKGKRPPGPGALERLEQRDLNRHPDSRRQAYADLFWALLNSSEFTFNH